jgi:aldose 1-epimerase
MLLHRWIGKSQGARTRGRILLRWIAIAGVAGLVACSGTGTKTTADSGSESTPAGSPSITSGPFGQVGGTPVSRYTLTSGHGMRVRILTYGGIVQSIEVPDRTGHVDDVVLGFPTVDGYLNNTGSAKTYFGAIIGRYGNRIAKGTFWLNGTEYHVPINNDGNSLHGGTAGFDTKVWQASPQNGSDSESLKLQYVSPAGEMGYPGMLTTTVTYTVDQKNELRINYHATTDAPTVINLTNHRYFNLADEDTLDVYNQKVTINADNYTPTDPTQIPTGQIDPVKGTPFDFTSPTAIGAHITANDPQLLLAQGYDHKLGDQPRQQHRAGAGRQRRGSPDRARPDRLHHRTRCAVLQLQLRRRRVHGHQRSYLPAGLGIHDGDPALPGFAESTELPDHNPQPGPNLRLDNGFCLRHQIEGTE